MKIRIVYKLYFDDVITGQSDLIVTLTIFGTQDRLLNLGVVDINPFKTHKLTNIHHFDLVLGWVDYAQAMVNSDLATPIGFISFRVPTFFIILSGGKVKNKFNSRCLKRLFLSKDQIIDFDLRKALLNFEDIHRRECPKNSKFSVFYKIKLK